jgi:hypothetical protein
MAKQSFGLPFRLIDSRISGGVDDDLRFHPPNHIPNRLLVAEIAFAPANQNHIASRAVQAGKLTPHLSVFSGNQNSHAFQLV